MATVMPEMGFDDEPISPVMRDETVTKKKQTVAVSPDESRALAEFIAEMKAEDTTVVVVIPPASRVLSETVNGLSGGTYMADYTRTVRETSEAAGVPVVDLSGKKLPEEWYYDATHFNVDAQKVFTDDVVSALNKLRVARQCGDGGAARAPR